jgi:hypothetical protein
VLRLRTMGALRPPPYPPVQEWADGRLEFSRTVVDERDRGRQVRRLILRHVMANPDKGVIFELYRPEVIDVDERHWRFRGVEPVSLGSEERGGMLQDWLVWVSA